MWRETLPGPALSRQRCHLQEMQEEGTQPSPTKLYAGQQEWVGLRLVPAVQKMSSLCSRILNTGQVDRLEPIIYLKRPIIQLLFSQKLALLFKIIYIFTYYSNNFTDYSSNLPLILTFNSIIVYVLSIRKVINQSITHDNNNYYNYLHFNFNSLHVEDKESSVLRGK